MTNANDCGNHECAICQDTLKNPITLPCNHRYCSDCLDSWRCRHVFDKQKTCPECRSKIPVTKSMVAQLESFRRLRSDLENKLNKRPCPLPALPGTADYNYTKGFYGNIGDSEIVRIRNLSPELQQRTLRSILETAHAHFDCQIRDLEEQISDGIVLEEYNTQTEDCDELPNEIGVACENNNVEMVLEWLGDPPIPSRRINAKNSKSNEMTLLHHATKGNRINLVRFLLQNGADIKSPTAMGLSSFLASCTCKRYESIAMLFLEWGADKDATAPGPPGVGDVTAMDIARGFAENDELVEVLKSPLGGRRCQIDGLKHGAAEIDGRTCIVGKYFEATEEYAVTIGDDSLRDGDARTKIKSRNLKRRDRTTQSPGFVLEFHGREAGSNAIKWKTKNVSKQDLDYP